jgi:hypothetical protein
MAAHGVSRSTLDVDLLTTDARVLDQRMWHAAQGASTDIRLGDADDPLLGVVRVRRDERQVDVIVGRHAWQTAIVDGARPVDIEGESIPVADAAGLILLKLYAGWRRIPGTSGSSSPRATRARLPAPWTRGSLRFLRERLTFGGSFAPARRAHSALVQNRVLAKPLQSLHDGGRRGPT